MTRLRRIIAVLTPLAVLSACASDGGGPAEKRADAITPTEQYSISVTSQPDQIALKVHAEGLSAAQQAALVDLASRWRERGAGELVIQAPVSGEPASGWVMAEQSRAILISQGVPAASISLVGYNNASDQPVTVLAGFTAYQAKGPECGKDWDNFTSTGSNKPYRQFGCATTANMAAQIANPADLMAPRATTPADASRRSVVLGKYRAGEETASAAKAEAKASGN